MWARTVFAVSLAIAAWLGGLDPTDVSAAVVTADYQCSSELGGEFVLTMSAAGYPAGTWVDFFLFPEDFYLGGSLSEGRTITQMIGGFVGSPFQPTPFTLPPGPHSITANIRDPSGHPSDSFFVSPDVDHDRFCENQDNCPQEFNPDQIDTDGDSEGDACDLDDGVILLSLSDLALVTYQQEANLLAFNIYRGEMELLVSEGIYTQDTAQVPSAAQFCGEIGGQLSDGFVPALGGVVFYLATGIGSGGLETTLGSDSAGRIRPNHHPCP